MLKCLHFMFVLSAVRILNEIWCELSNLQVLSEKMFVRTCSNYLPLTYHHYVYKIIKCKQLIYNNLFHRNYSVFHGLSSVPIFLRMHNLIYTIGLRALDLLEPFTKFKCNFIFLWHSTCLIRLFYVRFSVRIVEVCNDYVTKFYTSITQSMNETAA
jgi:hypothetical protein